MKKGISIWSIPNKTLPEAFKLAKELGYDGVEVGFNVDDGELCMNTTEEEALKIKAAAEEAGIELYSLSSGAGWGVPATSDDPEVREKAKAIIRKQLEVASWLGCDTILVVPGYCGVSWRPTNPVVPYDVAYDRAFEAIKELAPYAEEKKVAIGVENVWNKMFLSPLEMRDFIDKIGSPYVGVYLDVGNMVQFGYPEHWINILGSRIKKVHFKDFKIATNSFVDLLEGDIDFPAVMEAFKNVGYDGWCTAEMGVYKNYPHTLLKVTSLAMDEIFA
ncbi:MAG: sugar phosphate isomerase/epimerase [Ruminococcaceae bacterium]|nr:sugar phosphate isomerase/epimerase [Oscillospiraceae bacterium]